MSKKSKSQLVEDLWQLIKSSGYDISDQEAKDSDWLQIMEGRDSGRILQDAKNMRLITRDNRSAYLYAASERKDAFFGLGELEIKWMSYQKIPWAVVFLLGSSSTGWWYGSIETTRYCGRGREWPPNVHRRYLVNYNRLYTANAFLTFDAFKKRLDLLLAGGR